MTKQEIIAKVNELIAAPSVCAPVKSAAEAYIKAQDKASADALVKALAENVNSIDETIGFAGSEMGRQIFGAETAEFMVKKGNEVKAAGGKYCFCPACQAGSVIYENKEILA